VCLRLVPSEVCGYAGVPTGKRLVTG